MSPYPKHSLQFHKWPAQDQELWNALFQDGDLLGDRGPAANWAPATRETAYQVYGKWLSWLLINGCLKDESDPCARLTPDHIRDYIKDLELEAARLTVYGHIDGLLRLMLAVAPLQNWQWLKDICRRLRARIQPARDKHIRLRPSLEIYQLGLQLMETAPVASTRYSRHAGYTQYRDGLMISMLAARPLRLKNLAMIEIDQHLCVVDDTYWLRFDGSDVKNRRPIEVPLPQELSDYIDTYIRDWRPTPICNSKRLWLAYDGRPLNQKSLYWRITTRTRSAFGRSISPHLFRDCLATSIAIEDPRHVRISANLLGHSSLETSEKHYNQAHMIEAGRDIQRTINTLRKRTKRTSPHQKRKVSA